LGKKVTATVYANERAAVSGWTNGTTAQSVSKYSFTVVFIWYSKTGTSLVSTQLRRRLCRGALSGGRH